MYTVHCTAEVHERLGGYERRVEGGWPGGAGDGVSLLRSGGSVEESPPPRPHRVTVTVM